MSPRQYENYDDHKEKDYRPENGHHSELSLFQFPGTTSGQNCIAPVPPQKGAELSAVDQNDKSRRDETDDRKQ